jgi:hydroxyethylthiazole kinase-like uncharacterized protein yjeF
VSGGNEITPAWLGAHALPAPGGSTDKDARGRVLVVGGSAEVPGGLLLAGLAAMRAGAGKLQLAAPASIAPGVAVAVPEARVFALPESGGEIAGAAAERLIEIAARCDALAIGPGMLDQAMAAQLAARVLRAVEGPGLVVDAAALNGLLEAAALLRRHAGRLVITPHAGEMANLMDRAKAEVEADPLVAARQVAAKLQAVVVLKGRDTVVVSPSGEALHHQGGVVGLATSGSGDVLAGVIAGLLARGAVPVQAAAWGVYLHGRAGARLSERMGSLGFLAREIAGEIPALMDELTP